MGMNILNKIIDLSKKSQNGQTVPDSFSFKSLAPKNNTPDKTYCTAIEWALENREKENIRNIAISGPYGSGKSTIINSFFERYKSKYETKTLNISLATFKDSEQLKDIDPSDSEAKPPSNDEKGEQLKGKELQRRIEVSILQQLVHREKDDVLPDSRMRKIRHRSKKHILLKAVSLLLFLLCAIHSFANNKFDLLISLIQHRWTSFSIENIVDILSILVLLFGSLCLSYKFLRLLNSIRFKLSFQNAEIEVDSNVSKSILNSHLDEIIYFFEATKYEIVIIEDLDRFEQADVFTKLREINLLLNESKKIKPRHIVFIYAIRDDMFKDNDRSKFFDFIIPVIPFSNSSNSGDLILNEKLDIDSQTINDFSLFLDDTRLVYNIINEYQIYKYILNETLNVNNLFAIIVYKNLYPTDFVELSHRKGVFFEELDSKRQFIDKILARNNERITEIESKLEISRNLHITNQKDLKRLYILEYINHINTINTGFSKFFYNGQLLSIDQVIADDAIFSHFIKNEMKYRYQQSNYGQQTNGLPQFSEIEKAVDANHTYNERSELITEYNADKTDEYTKQIEKLTQENALVASKPLRDIYKLHNTASDDTQHKLIAVMILNGYVDENYIDYISLFHEGSLTKSDKDFQINVRANRHTEFSYKLKNIEKIIQDLADSDFEKPCILNFDLMDYLLSNSIKYATELQCVYHTIRDNQPIGMKFTGEFCTQTKNESVFINGLAHEWENFWAYCSQHNPQSETYLWKLLDYADIEGLKIQAENSKLLHDVAVKDKVFEKENVVEKLKPLIESNKIKLDFQNLNSLSEDVFNWMYKNNHYMINKTMIKLILERLGVFNQELFYTQNYSAIMSSNAEGLIKYINNNLKTYIVDVYLRIDSNTQEDCQSLHKLLNDGTIELELKERIIQQVSTRFDDLNEIEDIEMSKLLLKYSRVVPNWDTLLDFYAELECTFCEELIIFLNDNNNAKVLSDSEINEEYPDTETVNKFLLDLIYASDLSDDVYVMLTKSIPYWYSALDFDRLTQTKTQILIDNVKVQPSSGNFSNLKSKYPPLHIDLLVKYPEQMLKEWDNLSLDNNDIQQIFSSKVLTTTKKLEIYNEKLDDDMIIQDAKLFDIVRNLALNESDFIVRVTLLEKIISKFQLGMDAIENKIDLLVKNISQYSGAEIDTLLSCIGNDYLKLVHQSYSYLEDTSVNRKLTEKLKTIGYLSSYSVKKNKLRLNKSRKST
jgi:hypothetical protein